MDDTKPEDGRRKGDRREAQAPFEGEDRRKGERRSGEDRRATPRSPTEE
jgi:hypothetical protein